ncbi:MAG: 4-alpha-glucanotransferase, partial [Gemmatimonadaceae bacterium]
MTPGGHHDARLSPLHELAAHAGIVAAYHDIGGVEHLTTDDTRRTMLAALGIDASPDSAVSAALARLRAERRASMIPNVRVVRAGASPGMSLNVRAPAGAGAGRWKLELQPENGDVHRLEGPWPSDHSAEFALPDNLPLGYHIVRFSVSSYGREWRDEQTLIVVPPRCVVPEQLLGGRRAFGLIANLYTVRSATNWGVGDFSDLGALASWGGSIGADFVGVNPLHALLNRGPDVGPYSPVSRIYRNPIYIDVARVPELQQSPEIGELLASGEVTSEIEALRRYHDVHYEQVMGVKGLALTALHGVFAQHVRASGSMRGQQYADYVCEHEPSLSRFALWMAIAERHGRDWHDWPTELHDPAGSAVSRFAGEHAERVDYHRWLQFEADRQLGNASVSARDAGMRIGLYQDLAIGTAAASADTWAFPGLFVRGMSIGAPPDPYSAAGQNWHLPPIDPRALRANGYEYFINLVRSGFRHGGALRIDHAMGLFRLFWIPQGCPASQGTYVRYPSEDLLGILALESVRHKAIVVGEDLGTVPPEVPPALARWGVLSSKVLYFEREWDGRFKPSHAYPSLALATANTHDVPTLAGFWQGRDIETRVNVGILEAGDAAQHAHQERDRERGALLHLLASERILPHEAAPAAPADLSGAVHEFLCRTPAELVGLSLDDLAGELDSVNVPGVGPERHSSWTRKMRLPLEELAASDDVRKTLR